MLATLKVRDLLLIENVTLDFSPGLNVLTGETGAGKSILLDALGLAAGARAAGRSTVRGGAQQGSAVAIFDLPDAHAARVLIGENGIVCDEEIILRRTITAEGRTRAYANDEPIGVALLRELGSVLVEIHGQVDDRGLFDAATHRKLLDGFGGHETLSAETALSFANLDRARAEADALCRAAAADDADLEYLRHAVNELSQLKPETGEETQLASERALLQNASRIVEEVAEAVENLAGRDGAESALAAALKRLGRLNAEARTRTAAAEIALDQAFALSEEARRVLEALLLQLSADPGELERKEERLFELRAAARKHATQVDQLPAILAGMKEKLDKIESSDTRLKAAEENAIRAREAWLHSAGRLSAARAKAARKLEAAVAGELAPLKLGHAAFRVALEPQGEGNANGLERVAFEVATVAGAPFGPLVKIASGGELARFSLALKVALAEASPPAALVFDEVDRGVGGAVADAVGHRLQNLARSTQILLVTHSPQVAARAARHFRIARSADRTRVDLLDDDARIEEIARMLSGAAVTAEARAAARRLVAEAQEAPKKSLRKRA